MNVRKNLVLSLLGLLGLSVGLGFVLGQQKSTRSDKSMELGTNYKITGHIEPIPGQTFPSSWGRLVNYTSGSDNNGIIKEQRFVFEASDGTIRVVKTDLNWNRDLIDDAEIITIGRN